MSGIFGMNLLSGLEAAPKWFWATTAGIFVGIFVITGTTLVYIYRRLRHSQARALPSPPGRRPSSPPPRPPPALCGSGDGGVAARVR